MPVPRSPSPHEFESGDVSRPVHVEERGAAAVASSSDAFEIGNAVLSGALEDDLEELVVHGAHHVRGPAELAVGVTTGLAVDARRRDTAADQRDHSAELVGAAIDRDRIHTGDRLLEADQGNVVLVAGLPLGVQVDVGHDMGGAADLEGVARAQVHRAMGDAQHERLVVGCRCSRPC